MNLLRRNIHPETRIADAKLGLVEYIASDETLDSYKEIIRADGWRFDHFEKNAPFVDSHRYGSLEAQLGKVVAFEVKDGRLLEQVKWAIDVPENQLARLGFKMTEAGYLKAVSVGFFPTKVVSKWDRDPRPMEEAMRQMNLPPDCGVRAIYLEQQQVELSSCILGANPNALARAYKAEVISESDLDFLAAKIEVFPVSSGTSPREHAASATDPADADAARQRARVRLHLTVLSIASRL